MCLRFVSPNWVEILLPYVYFPDKLYYPYNLWLGIKLYYVLILYNIHGWVSGWKRSNWKKTCKSYF